MSGLDELFADVSEDPETQRDREAGRAPGSRWLGALALASGLLAFAGNVGGIATAIAVILSVAQNVGDPGRAPDVSWVILYERVVVIGGIVLGLAGLVLGAVSARLRRGRAFGIVGAVAGSLALGADVVIIVLLAVVVTG
jgi:hypothetical protein